MWLARHRWYDPELGRWVSRDPIGSGGGDPNLLGYVGGTVTGMVDPLGLKRSIIQCAGCALFRCIVLKQSSARWQATGRLE